MTVLAQATYNAAGLVVAAIFVVLGVTLVVWASLANRRRSTRATEYSREEHVTGTPATPLPAHVWLAVAAPDLAPALGFPPADAVAQMPALERMMIHRAEAACSNARSSAVGDITVVVFDHAEEVSQGDGQKLVRTVRGRFGLQLNCPTLDITAVVGLGTFALEGGRVQSFKFESDDFNHAFSVVGDNPQFAFSLFDGEMMLWLLAHSGLRSMHVQGPNVLVVFNPVDPATDADADADAVLAFVSGFDARIASIVRDEWPLPAR